MLFPSRPSSEFGNVLPLFGRERFSPRFSTLQSANTTLGESPFGRAHGILSLARGNVHDELGELVRIAWTFRHGSSMSRETYQMQWGQNSN